LDYFFPSGRHGSFSDQQKALNSRIMEMTTH